MALSGTMKITVKFSTHPEKSDGAHGKYLQVRNTIYCWQKGLMKVRKEFLKKFKSIFIPVTTVKCSSCLDMIDVNHEGIQCAQGHHLCPEMCSRQFVDTILEEPHQLTPVKCPICKVILNDDMMQRVMTEEQVQKYQYQLLQGLAVKSEHQGEVLYVCPFCKYFEYRIVENDDILFIHCQESNCQKTSCFFCHSSVNSFEEEVLDRHLKCATLSKLKNEFESIILTGLTMACPRCGLAGVKDESCCHMTCPSCETEWCYVCGKDEIAIDKEEGDDFYGHFVDYLENTNRCPQYLILIWEINEDYPEDELEALEKFHENRCKMMLKVFVDKIGEEKFVELNDHFECVKNCGFTLQDILDAPSHEFRPEEDENDYNDDDTEDNDEDQTADHENCTENEAIDHVAVLDNGNENEANVCEDHAAADYDNGHENEAKVDDDHVADHDNGNEVHAVAGNNDEDTTIADDDDYADNDNCDREQNDNLGLHE